MEVILALGNGFITTMYYSNITQQHCLGVQNMDSKFSLPEMNCRLHQLLTAQSWTSYITSSPVFSSVK